MKHKIKRLLKYPYLNMIDRGGVYDDLTHLKACYEFLRDSFEYGCLRSHFDMASNTWGNHYFEISGYAIPTFIEMADFLNKPYNCYLAVEIGNFLLANQKDDGTLIEPNSTKPDCFNIAQIMIGWLALYEETKDEKYLNACIKSADWIIKQQNKDGSFNYVYSDHPMNIRIAWALYELFKIIERAEYYNKSENHHSLYLFAMEKATEYYKMKTRQSDWLHFLGYEVVGKQKLGINMMLGYNVYYHNYQLTGQAQMIFAGVGNYDLEHLKKLQFMGKKYYGGLPGSDPLYGGYFPAAIPTWGVKFLADCLLKNLGANTKYLG